MIRGEILRREITLRRAAAIPRHRVPIPRRHDRTPHLRDRILRRRRVVPLRQAMARPAIRRAEAAAVRTAVETGTKNQYLIVVPRPAQGAGLFFACLRRVLLRGAWFGKLQKTYQRLDGQALHHDREDHHAERQIQNLFAVGK